MEQFYQPPKQHHRLDIQDLFPQVPCNPQRSDFVPFSQERDKLGRLITKESRDHKEKFTSSCQLTARSVIKRPDLTDRGKNTDDRVRKIFKVHSIPQFHKAKDKTLRVTISQSKKNTMPAVGQYDFAVAADKIKYNRAKEAEIKPRSFITKNFIAEVKHFRMPSKLRIEKLPQQQHFPILQHNKLDLNPNLPQLQKFHTMQKLQMTISANFQRDHEKFKNLVRQSLLLSSKIRRQLELD